MLNDFSYKRKVIISFLIIGLTTVLIVGCQSIRDNSVDSRTKSQYTQEYIDENKGKVIVEIPEVYELANIAIAITDQGLENSSRVFKDGEYYEKVLEHFLPFKNHPLISKINFSDIFDYYRFRENSFCYGFNDDSIVSGEIYYNIWQPNLFENHIKLVENFAQKSQFRKFYQDNLAYYQQQIEDYKEKVPIRKMWTWLENKFPNKYDCYKIIFSPLISASHSTQRFNDKGFQETVMFVCGPDIYKKRYSGKVEEGLLSRIVFTEIDHNYVNPTTDKYIASVNKVFSNLKKWSGNENYQSAQATFNEYMTWAVFILFAYDNYVEEDFQIISQVTEELMAKRGFILFNEFSKKMLQIYLDRQKGEKIPDLYPKILEWAEKI